MLLGHELASKGSQSNICFNTTMDYVVECVGKAWTRACKQKAAYKWQFWQFEAYTTHSFVLYGYKLVKIGSHSINSYDWMIVYVVECYDNGWNRGLQAKGSAFLVLVIFKGIYHTILCCWSMN